MEQENEKYYEQWRETKEKWFNKAKRNIRTPDDLRDFAKELVGYVNPLDGKDYYNYSGLAASALSLAAANLCACVFGLSGFQMGCVMWDIIDNILLSQHDVGMRLLNFNDMLYPQYEHRFEKTIDKETWEALRKKASETLAQSGDDMCDEVREHIRSIADGNIPFGYTVEVKETKGEDSEGL